MVTVALVSRTKYHRATPCIRFILVTRTYERTVQKKKRRKKKRGIHRAMISLHGPSSAHTLPRIIPAPTQLLTALFNPRSAHPLALFRFHRFTIYLTLRVVQVVADQDHRAERG